MCLSIRAFIAASARIAGNVIPDQQLVLHTDRSAGLWKHPKRQIDETWNIFKLTVLLLLARLQMV